jgi:hypothetical protein
MKATPRPDITVRVKIRPEGSCTVAVRIRLLLTA